MRPIILLISVVFITASCNTRNSITLNGLIKGETEKVIYLNKVDVNTPLLVDSAKVSKKGTFRFRFRASETDFYQLGFSGTNFITLLMNPGEKVDLTFTSKNLYENYNVSGSEGSLKLQELDITLAETKRKLDSLTTIYNKSASEPGFDVKGPALEKEFNELIKAQRKKNIAFIISNINSLASIKALYQTIAPDTYVLYEPNDLQYLKIVNDSLTKYYPNSKHVKALTSDLNNELNRMYAGKLGAIANELPQASLDPNLMNHEGKRIALSSLKGKYVLLTFWSLRSKECIVENMQLKQLYTVYKPQGFEIYQINLDGNEESWKSAVKFDELPWISTREDDPGNPVNARLFNVQQLPANYLFDREGNIIGSNLHGRALQIKLEQLFPKK